MSSRPAEPRSEVIGSLLVRNLFEVFDERDRDRRIAAIQELYTPDAIFCDRHGHHTGHRGIESAASGLLAMVPADFRFHRRLAAPLQYAGPACPWPTRPIFPPLELT